ncbi:MAG: hypothetical protein ACPF8V_10625, partial [Luteibaculum sp.]
MRGNTLYMATNNLDRVYKSEDYGDNWEVFYNGLPRIFGYPSGIAGSMLTSGDKVFLGGTNFGLRYSDLADTAWTETNKDKGAYVYALSLIGKDSIMVCQGGFNGGLSFFSSDNGETWTQLGAEPLPNLTISATAYAYIQNRLVAITDAGGDNSTFYS